MSQTRCKVRCTEVAQREGWSSDGRTLFAAKFAAADRSKSPENAAFFEATPSLSLEVQTVKGDHFQVGREYYLDFTPVSQ